jgi:hypothetical protein
VLALLAIGAGIAAVAFQGPILRRVGGVLLIDDPVHAVEIIVLPQWLGDAGALDAADLVKSGIADRVAVLPEPPKPAELELARRGVPFPTKTEDALRLLGLLGVTEVEVVPTLASSTEAEGLVLVAWCHERQFQRILVLSSPDHSRRVRRVLDRAFRGQPTQVLVRAARYSAFDPDTWWQTRDGLRIGIVECQKLLLDFARHPIS